MLIFWYSLLLLMIPFPLLALRAEHFYQTLSRLPNSQSPISNLLLPSLSIIIPARDEAENLRGLLPSLAALEYPIPVEVIVVDDNSTDETSHIARQYGAQVVQAGELLPGWLGKPNACHQGAQAARGEWLLFTDADTVHSRTGPVRAVQYALEHQLDGVSLFLAESAFGIPDKISLMAAFAGLFAGMRCETPLLNGQYILIRREVYEQSGGFGVVRGEALEDLALAHSLARQGYRVPILHGETAAKVNMYRDVHHLWHGLSRLGSGSLKWSGAGSLLTVLFIIGALLPVLAFPVAFLLKLPLVSAAGLWGIVFAFFLTWARRSGSWKWAMLAPVGALLVQMAATWGLVSEWLGKGVEWKGRRV